MVYTAQHPPAALAATNFPPQGIRGEAGTRASRFGFQAEDGIRDLTVTGVQTCALPICLSPNRASHFSGTIVCHSRGSGSPGLLKTLDSRFHGNDGTRESRSPREGDSLKCFLYSRDRKSTRLNSSHSQISYAVFCLKKKK